MPPSRTETVLLTEAGGRILATSVHAPLNLPPFDSSAMDGYAYRADLLPADRTLRIIGESLAGHPFIRNLGAGECIRITTGAAVPDSTDTVVIQENCLQTGDRLKILETPDQGENIRRIGHDVAAGTTICHRGKRLSVFDIGWLAACGVTRVEVYTRPRVAVFSTGDELIAAGEPLAAGQIYDANRYAVAALLGRLPVEVTDLGILPDDRAHLTRALAQAAEDHDLLLTSGGVSVGDADFLKEVVADLGQLELWRLNLKPGKPLAFGSIGRALFLGLPGNPVSTLVTYLLIGQPLLLTLAGTKAESLPPYSARLADPVRHTPGREEYQRGKVQLIDGSLSVSVTGDQSSNRLATFADANCLIRISKDSGDLNPGAEVEVLPFSGLVD